MSASPRAKELSRIPSLDGLRALSISLVIALHTLQRYSMSHSVGFAWFALFDGASGVFIFFEISGFLITTLLLQEHQRSGSVSLRGFYLRRVFRILPPLYFYIGVVILLGVIGRLRLNKMDIISGIFFFHNIAQGVSMWSFEHLWSISVEEQFYLWWPFLLVFCLRRSGTAGRYTAAILPIAILIVSPPLRVFFGRQVSHPLMHRIGTNYLNLDFLMFGCIVALLQHTPRFESIFRMATRIWWLPPAVMAVCSLLSARYQNYFNLPIGYTIDGAAIAMFLLWCTRNPESLIGRTLNWAPVAQIGVLSYSIYLWQTLFIHHSNVTVFGQSMFGRFPLNLAGILAVATFSYYVIEKPSMRLRSRIISRLRIYRQQRGFTSSGSVAIDS